MAKDLTGKKVAFLGAGKMGGIILQALLKNGLLSPKSTFATVAHEERAEALAAKLKVKVGTNNVEAARNADIIVIAVKPKVVEDVIREISGHITPQQLIVSVAASVPTSMIEKNLSGSVPVVRAMPNTPCQLGAGMTAISKGKHASAEDVAMTCHMFDVVGRTVVVDEKHMDAVTALSASGPAYIYIILESLAEAGAHLEYVYSQRSDTKVGMGDLYVAPLHGANELTAARKAGMHEVGEPIVDPPDRGLGVTRPAFPPHPSRRLRGNNIVAERSQPRRVAPGTCPNIQCEPRPG